MKRLLRSQWTIAIISTLFGFLLTVAYDIYKQQELFNTLGVIWDSVIKLFSVDIKLWLILVIMIIFILFKKIRKVLNKNENVIPNIFASYRSDVLKMWKWTWNWERNPYNQKMQIVDLEAKCPKCNSTLIFHENYAFGNSYECSKCNFETSEELGEVKYKIEKLINDKINDKQKQNI